MQIGEFCRVTNNGDDQLKVKYDGNVFNLPPKKEVVIPVAAAFLWFGDPRTTAKIQLLRNEQGKVNNMLPARGTEVKRLRFKYGGDAAGDETTFNDVVIPDVTLTDLDGEEVVTVLQDPLGRHSIAMSPEQEAANQNDQLLEIVKRQERQINILMKQLNVHDDTSDIPNNVSQEDLPTDDIPEARPFKVYNTESGMPGPSMGELVK